MDQLPAAVLSAISFNLNTPHPATVRALGTLLSLEDLKRSGYPSLQHLMIEDLPLLYLAATAGNVPAIGTKNPFQLVDSPLYVDFLVARGADLQCQESSSGSSPLHGACYNGFISF